MSRLRPSHPFGDNHSTVARRVRRALRHHSIQILAPESSFQFLTPTVFYLAILTICWQVAAQTLFDGLEMKLQGERGK
jgi:hypothetical protein